MNGCDVCAVKCWTPEGCFGFGKYNWSFLCMPQAPCLKKVNPPMFLGKDEKLPLLLSASMGLQHMLAMCVGIATSGGMLHANEACWIWNYDSDMCAAQSFLVSCSWFASGFLTMIQVFRCKIYKTPFYLGTGLVSVMGTSFTFLPIGQAMVSSSIAEAKAADDARCLPNMPYKGGPQTTMDCQGVAVEAYGKFLGTAMIASLLELVVGFTWKTKITKMFFPPVVVGMAVMMIGCALIASGIKYLGGGVFCAQNTMSKTAWRVEAGVNMNGQNKFINGPPFLSFFGPHICNESGFVKLVYGAPEYWGLALSVIFFGILIQVVGSPFLKSTFLFWSMMFGVIVAAVSSKYIGEDHYDPSVSSSVGTSLGYYDFDSPAARLPKAPVFTFFWAHIQFAPGFDIRYFLPLLICSWITTAETIGDVQMTSKFSMVTDPEEIESRIQGGVIADGVNSVIACLCGSPPNTTFSQNNGIIALTRCASRAAGFGCAAWLIVIGLFGKIGALMASIPMPIVGGVILQCFTMVAVAGIAILGPLLDIRRNQYIVMLSLAFGLGVALEPQTVSGNGVSSFHGKNLDFNFGLWPGKLTCMTFPTVTITTTPASCSLPYIDTSSFETSSGDTVTTTDPLVCGALGGNFTAAVTESVADTDCINGNGRCCLEYYEGAKAIRTSLLVVMKTPYGIAVMIAVLLNLIMPVEAPDEMEEGAAPKTATA